MISLESNMNILIYFPCTERWRVKVHHEEWSSPQTDLNENHLIACSALVFLYSSCNMSRIKNKIYSKCTTVRCVFHANPRLVLASWLLKNWVHIQRVFGANLFLFFAFKVCCMFLLYILLLSHYMQSITPGWLQVLFTYSHMYYA